MSEFTRVKIGGITDTECLKKALEEIGYTKVQIHDTSQVLKGYYNERVEAHVVIPKESNSTLRWGDMGFVKTSEGDYDLVIDASDHYGQKSRLDKLKREYLKHSVLKMSRKNACTTRICKVETDGRVRIRLLAP